MTEQEYAIEKSRLNNRIGMNEAKVKKYKTAKDTLNDVIKHLNSAKAYVQSAHSNYTSNISGSDLADGYKKGVEYQKSKIETIINKLKNKVIPAIDAKIKDLNASIKSDKNKIDDLGDKMIDLAMKNNN